jgi:hypothetical protein
MLGQAQLEPEAFSQVGNHCHGGSMLPRIVRTTYRQPVSHRVGCNARLDKKFAADVQLKLLNQDG